MAEIALVSARKARLEGQANKGDKNAQEALDLANNPDTFLSTVQIGITLIGVLTGIFSGENLKGGLVEFYNKFDALKHYSNGLATTTIVIIITYFSLVLGELVPKRIGLSNPEAIAKKLAGPMRIVTYITYPFIWLLSKSSNFLVSIFNIKSTDNQVTEEEIKAIISEGTEQGTIEEAEQEIIERVFHLGDRNITSLMTHRKDIIWFDADATVDEVKASAEPIAYSVYPVCEGNIDVIKGVVLLKNLFTASGDTKMKDLLQPAVYVPENNSAYQLLEQFKITKKHFAFIVNEYGSLEGIITINDIVEAIVGDIPQANDDDYEIVKRDDGTYLVDAQIPFYDFLARFEKTDWLNEEHDFDTLAGFVLHELERIPGTGDKLSWRGFNFEIVDMDNHRIDKLLVTISDQIKESLEEE